MGTMRGGESPGTAVDGTLRWVAFAAALVVNLVVLYAPDPGGPTAPVPGTDKVVHAAIFAVLTYAGLSAGLRARWFLPAVVAHAVSSELVQEALLSEREGDPWDAVADVAGVALGHLAHRAWQGRRQRAAPRP